MIKTSVAKILCIDNDTRSCDWIKIVLKGSKIDCNITTVTTGREAFFLLNKEKFDLCILEYSLPDMSGVQLCSLMRGVESDVPMMFFSAMTNSIHKANAMVAGATEYLAKPDDLGVFAETVSRLLRQVRLKRLRSVGRANHARAAM